MRLPFVSRLAFDAMESRAARAEAQSDRLFDQLIALRREGFAPVRPAKVIVPKEPEEEGMKRAESEFVDNMASELQQRHGMDPESAKREAKRVRAEIDDMQPRGT